MNEDTLEHLVPIIDHIAQCNPQEKKDILRAISYIQNYFKRLQSASNHFDYHSFLKRKCIEVPVSPSASLDLGSFKASMNFLHATLKAWKIVLHPDSILTLSHHLTSSTWDRYHDEFKELSILGAGAYGVVVKAKHLLDGRQYAVKKIPLKCLSHEDCTDVLKEVRILSQLSHPNIALYHSSWVQLYFLYSKVTVCEDDSVSIQSHLSDLSKEDPKLKKDESSDESVIFDDNSRKVDACCGSLSTTTAPSKQMTNQNSPLGSNPADRWLAPFTANSFEFHLGGSAKLNGSTPLLPTLFIQMQLGRENLEEWLCARNERYIKGNFSWNLKESLSHLKIFESLLSALKYVHSKGFVHRDVKPANVIFTKGCKEVVLTDFGLAKLIRSTSSSKRRFSSFGSSSCSLQTADIGTPTYAAPETSAFHYNCEIDIYSLGIILLELLHPFGSMSERAKVITDLKKNRHLDPLFIKTWKHLANLVLRMTEKDPKRRPSASHILHLMHLKALLPFDLTSQLESPKTPRGNLNLESIYRSYSERNVPKKVLRRFYSLPLPPKSRKISHSNLSKSGIFRSAALSFCQQRRKELDRTKCRRQSRRSSKDVVIKELERKIVQLEKQIESLKLDSGKA